MDTSDGHTAPENQVVAVGEGRSSGTSEDTVKRNAACSACRSRKIKCSGEKPSCETCLKASNLCVYPPMASRKRKRNRADFHSLFTEPGSLSNGGFAAGPDGLTGLAGDGYEDSTGYVGHPSLSVSASTRKVVFAEHDPALPAAVQPPQTTAPAADLNLPANFDLLNGLFPWHGFPHSASQGLTLDTIEASPLGQDQLWSLDSFLGFGMGDSGAIGAEQVTPDSGNGGTVQGAGSLASSSAPGKIPAGVRPKVRFRVPYFRFFGPTAIAPGYKQVTCDVSRPASPTKKSSASLRTEDPTLSYQVDTPVAMEEYPPIEAQQQLIPLFRLHFSYFFPFIDFTPDESGSYHMTTPPFLLNIVCALAAPYSPLYGNADMIRGPVGQPGPSSSAAILNNQNRRGGMQLSDAWAANAKEQVSRRLALASVEMLEALLLISWYEFGSDRDGGLWMYSGMALRMGQDLGLDTVGKQPNSDNIAAPGRPEETQRLLCALRMMDAILTIGTGRSGMFQSLDWIIPSSPPIAAPNGHFVPDPYPYLVRIFELADHVARILVKQEETSAANDRHKHLEKTQSDLSEFYTSLPSELRFETATFQVYASIAQGGAFVLLHLWFHTLIILTYQSFPLLPESQLAAPQIPDVAGREVSASSAKSIVDIVTFAELIDPKAITQPWINLLRRLGYVLGYQ